VNRVTQTCNDPRAPTLDTADINYRYMVAENKLIFTNIPCKAEFNMPSGSLQSLKIKSILDAHIFQINIPIVPLYLKPHVLQNDTEVNED
jgi:hypothetical protein